MEKSDVEVSHSSLVRLERVARAAGGAILEHYEGGVSGATATSKDDGSPVTEADYAAHQVIAEEIARWSAEVPIISEEAEIPTYKDRKQWRRFWLVDPLDGTKEFISRNGEFTVNIALIENAEPVMGVVYAPALDIMYVAGKGLGSWKIEKGGAPVSITRPLVARAGGVRVVESRSHGSAELEEYLASIEVSERVRVGSSLKFCWVAEGLADIYPRLGPTMEWDVAAGDCVYRNSAKSGQHASPLTYNKPDLRNGPFVLGLTSALMVSAPADAERGAVTHPMDRADVH